VQAELKVWRQVLGIDPDQAVEVGPDPDDHTCMKVSIKDCNETTAYITITTDAAWLLAEAINRCADELEKKKGKQQ